MVRLTKVALALSVGIWGLLSGLHNLAGYEKGLAAVREVLTMKTVPVQPYPVDNELIITLGFAFIWLSKLIGGTLCAWGSVKMWKVRNEELVVFTKAKELAIAGCVVIFLMLFLGFNLISTILFMVFMSPVVETTHLSWAFAGEIGIIMIFLHMRDV